MTPMLSGHVADTSSPSGTSCRQLWEETERLVSGTDGSHPLISRPQ